MGKSRTISQFAKVFQKGMPKVSQLSKRALMGLEIEKKLSLLNLQCEKMEKVYTECELIKTTEL